MRYQPKSPGIGVNAHRQCRYHPAFDLRSRYHSAITHLGYLNSPKRQCGYHKCGEVHLRYQPQNEQLRYPRPKYDHQSSRRLRS